MLLFSERLKFFGVLLGLATSLLILSGVSSVQALEPNDFGIPQSRRAHTDPNGKGSCRFNDADPVTYARAIVSWISDPNNPEDEKNPWPAGASSELSMRFNMLGHNCTSNTTNGGISGQLRDKNTLVSQANIVGASTNYASQGVTVTGLAPAVHILNWNNTHTPPEYFYVKLSTSGMPVHRNFKLEGINNLQTSPTPYAIKVTVTTRWVNKYVKGSLQPVNGIDRSNWEYVCVIPSDGSRQSVDELNGSNCDPNSTTVTVMVDKSIKAWVQGYKVIHANDGSHPLDSALNGVGIEMFEGPGSTKKVFNNPYSFDKLSGGSYRFRVTDLGSLPSGYTFLGYTLCKNSTSCHTTAHTASSSTASGQINISSPLTSNEYYDLWWHFGPPPTPPPPSCGPSQVNVFLPDRSPGNNGPPSSTTQPNSPYTQYTREGRTKVTGTDDISNGGARVGNLPYRLPLLSESYQSATISYQPFVDQCPYDRNQGSVNYTSYYREQRWRSYSSPSYYTCNGGDSFVGPTTCRHTYQVPSWHYHSNDGAYCGYYYVYHGHRRHDPHVYSYSCWHYGYHGQTAYYDYGATAWYNYYREGGEVNREAYGSSAGQVMQPCYLRTYDSSTSIGYVPSLTPDLEDPTQSSTGVSISVNFNVEFPERGRNDLRQPTRVNNLGYVVKYRTVRYDGVTTSSNSSSGSTNITATSTNKQSSGQFNTTFSIPVSIPGNLSVGDKVCWKVSVTTASFSPGSRKMGKVNVDGTIQSGSGWVESNEACTSTVVNKPYLKVYGGSVWAGSAFKDSNGNCTTNPSANIRTFARWNGGNSYGSSSQYAVIAQNAIVGNGTDQGFYSASQRAGNNGYLALTNTGFSSGNWGGNFGSVRCLPNFYDENYQSTRFPPGSPNAQVVSGSSISVGSLQDNFQYYKTGNLTINGGTMSKRATIYVDGDAIINSNIAYPGSYASYNPDTIPYLTIITRGNIYIPSHVTNISGLFIAQPDSSGNKGEIFTCSNGGAPYATSSLYGACLGVPVGSSLQARCNGGGGGSQTGLPLTINGSFIAKRTNFTRTNGSLRCAKPSEVGYPQPMSPPTAAEIFHVAPELYLGYPAFRTRNGQSTNDYGEVMSYTALPPIL